MLDIKFIRENKDLVDDAIKNKNISLDLDALLALDDKRRELIKETEEIRAHQKKMGADQRDQAKELKDKYMALDYELKGIESEFESMMLLVPNIFSPDSPIGSDCSGNQEIYKWGKIPEFDFDLKDHIQLGKDLDIIDTEIGTKVGGFRGYYLKNEAVILQMALVWHCLDKLREKGYQLMIPPTIIKEQALIGSGHFPTGKDNIYQVAAPRDLCQNEEDKEIKYLGGTSESALLAYYSNQAIDESQLPIKMGGYSHCYRSEIGSYGKDTKGLYRVHEFMKVEQVVLCKDDLQESLAVFEELKNNACEILEELGLPYRVLAICTGDMGAGKYKMYDIETWMPSRNEYGETHSDSHLTDWQARRLNIKYKDKEGNKKFVYTLNNTMIASPRILIALLENFQQPDGSVKIPKVLQKYTGFESIKPK